VTFSNTFVCGTSVNTLPAAIFRYQGAPNSLPTHPGAVPPEQLCVDTHDVVPIVSRTAPKSQFAVTPSDTIPLTLEVDAQANQVFWLLNGSSINVNWSHPTLEFVQQGNTNYPTSENLIMIPNPNQWVFWLIQNSSPLPHPIHLHGHDFLVLGRSVPPVNPFALTGPILFNSTTDQLNFNNPTRRDVTLLPAWGWLVVAFITNNPGAWLMHCHIAWHVSQGLSVQFLEQVSKIPSAVHLGDLEPNCNNWRAYHDPEPQIDSGLRF